MANSYLDHNLALLAHLRGILIAMGESGQVSDDSVEKVGLAAAGRSNVPAVEVAGSHFKLPFGVSLSFFAQV